MQPYNRSYIAKLVFCRLGETPEPADKSTGRCHKPQMGREFHQDQTGMGRLSSNISTQEGLLKQVFSPGQASTKPQLVLSRCVLSLGLLATAAKQDLWAFLQLCSYIRREHKAIPSLGNTVQGPHGSLLNCAKSSSSTVSLSS